MVRSGGERDGERAVSRNKGMKQQGGVTSSERVRVWWQINRDGCTTEISCVAAWRVSIYSYDQKAFCSVGSSCMSLKGSQRRFKWCSYIYQNWVGLKASHTWSPLGWGFSSTSLYVRSEIFIGITHTCRHTPTTSNSVFAANTAVCFGFLERNYTDMSEKGKK